MKHSQDYWGELEALDNDTSRWPAGDNRAKAKELIKRAKEELIRAEAADDRDRSPEQYIEAYHELIKAIFKELK